MEDEKVEEVKEESTTSTDDTQVSEVTTEEAQAPEPGSIEYTKAVEERIGKVTKSRYQAEAERDLYKKRVEELESRGTNQLEKQVTVFNEAEPQETAYENYSDYVKALSSWQFRKEKVETDALTAHQREQNRLDELERGFYEKVRESKIELEHPDFHDKIKLVSLAHGLSDTVLASDKAPELALHLANNPEIIRELNSQSPLVAAKKLGIIEAKLSSKVKTKTTSSAPDPLNTVDTDTNVTTEQNPKDINAWMAKRKERELAKIKQNIEGGRA